MAKSGYALPVPERPGPVISTYAFTTTGHKRPSVALGDCDAAGQDLLVELPAHDDADRGSPLKIGGRASAAPFTAAAANDRVDAWFTLQGQQGVVAMKDASYIYDQGRRAVGAQIFNVGTSTVSLIGAAAGLRTMVLSAHLACSSFSTPGVVQIQCAGTTLLVWYISGLGNYPFPATGFVILGTSVNAALDWIAGPAGFAGSLHLTWYQCP